MVKTEWGDRERGGEREREKEGIKLSTTMTVSHPKHNAYKFETLINLGSCLKLTYMTEDDGDTPQ